MSMKFRFVGGHAEDLASGRVLEPGETVTLSKEEVADPHNARLIADEKLIGVTDRSQEAASKTAAKTDKESDA